MQFHFNKWLVYFYFYCMFGWGFESSYVSIRTRKPTNRGFMKGPWLPLYGFGAVLILLVTLPFEKQPAVVYFAGMLAATILEYVTGVAMVKLFKVRYWDYSYRKIQFQGHICLHSSIAWGGLSLLMVYGIHPFVSRMIAGWNENVVNVITFFVTIFVVYDFTNAFREAMDLRALIIQAEELRKRMEDAVAEKKEHILESLEEKKERMAESIDERKEHFAESVQEAKEKLAELEEAGERIRRRAELEEARERIRKRMEDHSRQLLLHNPGSSFFGMKEESGEIRRRLLERRKHRWKNEENCRKKP